jgi:hypothetical protein
MNRRNFLRAVAGTAVAMLTDKTSALLTAPAPYVTATERARMDGYAGSLREMHRRLMELSEEYVGPYRAPVVYVSRAGMDALKLALRADERFVSRAGRPVLAGIELVVSDALDGTEIWVNPMREEPAPTRPKARK